MPFATSSVVDIEATLIASAKRKEFEFEFQCIKREPDGTVWANTDSNWARNCLVLSPDSSSPLTHAAALLPGHAMSEPEATKCALAACAALVLACWVRRQAHSARRHVRRHHKRAARPCEARARRVRSVSCGAAAAAQALPEATFTKRTSRCTALATPGLPLHATVRVFGLARAWGRFTVAAPQRESNCETNPQWRSESGSSGFCKTLKSGERCNCQP